MANRRLLTLAGIILIGQTACLDLIRRPGAAAGRDEWNGGAGASTSPATAPVDRLAASQDSLRPAVPKAAALPPAPPPGPDSRERIRRVNEYALWCIEQSLWNEARSHLERALESEPGSASLHNNLAIVLEHLGAADSAAAYYRQALELAPDAAAYRRNLERLQRHQRAAADTLDTVDLLDLKQRTPGPQQAPY